MSTNDETYDLGDWVRDHEDEVRAWSAVDGPGRRSCLVDACDRPVERAGLCSSHCYRARTRWRSERLTSRE